MKIEEARIAAHICGDGCLTTWIEPNALQIVNGRRYHQKRRRYEIIYTNTDQQLLNEFAKDLKTVFGVKPKKKKNDIRTRSKRIFEIIKRWGGGSSYEWKITPVVFDASMKARAAWLRAFFDDESTVELKYNRIRVKNMNKHGLKQVMELLSTLKVTSNITGQNIDDSWYLTIRKPEVKRFIKIVGSNHTKKSKKLLQLLRQVK